MIDLSLWVAVIGLFGSIGAVFVANRFTTRSTRAAQLQTAAIERTKVDALAYERARQSYDAALATQNRRLADLQQELNEDREEYRTGVAECKQRIRELEDARRADQVRIRNLVAYMRVLIGLLRQHEIAYPLPPIEMDGL